VCVCAYKNALKFFSGKEGALQKCKKKFWNPKYVAKKKKREKNAADTHARGKRESESDVFS